MLLKSFVIPYFIYLYSYLKRGEICFYYGSKITKKNERRGQQYKYHVCGKTSVQKTDKLIVYYPKDIGILQKQPKENWIINVSSI